MSFSLIFHGDLPKLLRHKWRGQRNITMPVNRRASIKDLVESLGLPHTEVGRLVASGQERDFSFIVHHGDEIDIHPVSTPWDIRTSCILRPGLLTKIAFVVDVNVGKLARLLRMVGLDTAYDRRWDDSELALVAEREKRILLTKDRGLLSRKMVVFGRYIRKEEPKEQLKEVIQLFNLDRYLAPFSRCMECNGLLVPVAKEEIIHRLLPLTRKYYNSFSICKDCQKVYWKGSHLTRMEEGVLSDVF